MDLAILFDLYVDDVSEVKVLLDFRVQPSNS